MTMTTIKIKTADLTGAALDWAVAIAERATPNLNLFICSLPGKTEWLVFARNPETGLRSSYSPSRNREQGHSIAERDKIAISPSIAHSMWVACLPTCLPMMPFDTQCFSVGPTPLIAAMRCYVASKLGAEVDVPQELVQ